MIRRPAAVSRFGLFSRDFLRHVLQKVSALTLGAALVSAPIRALRACLDRADDAPFALRAAIVAHAFYPELIDEILRCRDRLPAGSPVFITTPPERLAAAEAAVADAPGVTLIATPNRGRDIAPFLALLGSGALAPYDAVLKLHTKRSPHLLDGEIRRKLLFDRLCGSRRRVQRVLRGFLDARVGLVGWRASFRRSPPYWMANRARVEALAKRIGVEGEARLGFFEGTMFWFRPAALQAITDIALVPEDFEGEAGQIDGALHHAVERLFAIAAWSRGYAVRDLSGRDL